MAIIQKSFSDLVDFTRGSEATYTDATGNIRTAAIDEPRFTYDPATGEALGLLVEGQATNLLLNSDVVADQTIIVPSGNITLSFYGEGEVSFTGAATGSLQGTGSNDRSAITVTAAAGALVLSVTDGSPSLGQLEAGTRPTSYIPTEGSQVTRAADSTSISTDSFPFNPLEGTFIIKLRRDYDYSDPFANTVLSIMDDTNHWSLELGGYSRTRSNVAPLMAGIHKTPYVTFDGEVNKVALSVHGPNQYKMAVNGRVVNVSGDISGAYSVYQSAKEIRLKRSGNAAIGEDKFSEVTYYPCALTDAQLQEMTS